MFGILWQLASCGFFLTDPEASQRPVPADRKEPEPKQLIGASPWPLQNLDDENRLRLTCAGTRPVVVPTWYKEPEDDHDRVDRAAPATTDRAVQVPSCQDPGG